MNVKIVGVLAVAMLVGCGGMQSVPGMGPVSPLTHYSASATPVLAVEPGQWDSAFNSDPWPIQVNGQWFMYYWGASAGLVQPPCIGFATSPDLQSFTRNPANPVLCPSASAWDTAYTHKASIIPMPDGTFKMVYEGFNGMMKAIGAATAPAASGPWTRVNGGNAPLFLPSGAGELLNNMAPVIFSDGAQVLHVFYAGQDSQAIWRIFHATSSDGVNWAKHGLVLDVSSDPAAFDFGWIAPDSILFDGSQFIMSYNAGDVRATAPIEENGPSGCGLATSPDLEHWTKFSGNPILSSTASMLVWRCHLMKVNGQSRIYFNATQGNVEQIFLANPS